MKKIVKSNGYSSKIAESYVNIDEEFLVISPEVIFVKKYDKNLKTYLDEIDSYKIKVVQKDTEDFFVKFSKEIDVKQFDRIKLKNLEAIEISKNVYFRAEDLEVISHVKL